MSDHMAMNNNYRQAQDSSVQRDPSDRRVLACNCREGSSSITAGAKCYVLATSPYLDSGQRIKILARSRSGRWIEKIENLKKLEHFRWVTIPKDNPRYRDFSLYEQLTDADLARMESVSTKDGQ